MSKSILSLLIMVPFLILIGAVFSALIKKPMPQRLKRVFKWKTNLFLAGVYLAVLILLVPLALMLDQGGVLGSGSSTGKELLAEAPSNLAGPGWERRVPMDGRFEEQEGYYKNSSQTFQVEGSQLKIKTDGTSEYGQIFLERKKSADGLIEVSTYVAPHYARSTYSKQIDYTKMVAPPQISLEKEILKIEAPPEQKLVFKEFSATFIVSQFKEGVQNNYGGMMAFGEKGILIRVPSDLEIVSDDYVQIQWVK